MEGLDEAVVALVGEEPALAVDAAAVAGEGAVGADDAMAGDDDADRIRAIREADGADGFGAADALGELAVGDGRAAGDLAEGEPDFALEGSAKGGDGEGVDGGEIAVEVGA